MPNIQGILAFLENTGFYSKATRPPDTRPIHSLPVSNSTIPYRKKNKLLPKMSATIDYHQNTIPQRGYKNKRTDMSVVSKGNGPFITQTGC